MSNTQHGRYTPYLISIGANSSRTIALGDVDENGDDMVVANFINRVTGSILNQ